MDNRNYFELLIETIVHRYPRYSHEILRSAEGYVSGQCALAEKLNVSGHVIPSILSQISANAMSSIAAAKVAELASSTVTDDDAKKILKSREFSEQLLCAGLDGVLRFVSQFGLSESQLEGIECICEIQLDPVENYETIEAIRRYSTLIDFDQIIEDSIRGKARRQLKIVRH